MKIRTLTSLLLTGAVLTCSQSVYARQDEHAEKSQALIAGIQDKLDQLKEMHAATVKKDTPDPLNNIVPAGAGKIEAAKPLVPAEEDVTVADVATRDVIVEPAQSKMHTLIKKYMEARADKVLAADMEKEIKGEFATSPKNACFETVKYIQDKDNPTNEMKLGTLFNVMQIPDAYYKTVKDTLKGIRHGVQVRVKDERGVYSKQKMIFTPGMLCTK